MTIKELEIQLALGSLSYEDKVELAYKPSASKKILTRLSEDKDAVVRTYAAHNPNTPKRILTILSTDKDMWVRASVAGNLNTPTKTLKMLSIDKYKHVKWWANTNLDKRKHAAI